MRVLKDHELAFVTGAGNCCHPTPPCHRRRGPQGNNGYGNGGDDGVPGNSNKQDCTR